MYRYRMYSLEAKSDERERSLILLHCTCADAPQVAYAQCDVPTYNGLFSSDPQLLASTCSSPARSSLAAWPSAATSTSTPSSEPMRAQLASATVTAATLLSSIVVAMQLHVAVPQEPAVEPSDAALMDLSLAAPSPPTQLRSVEPLFCRDFEGGFDDAAFAAQSPAAAMLFPLHASAADTAISPYEASSKQVSDFLTADQVAQPMDISFCTPSMQGSIWSNNWSS